MKIAFFDSGIGGLTVLNEAMKVLPHESFVYYADSDNVPYGIKSKNEVSDLVHNAVQFLAQFDLKALVVACNTATSVVINELRSKYKFPIVGMEPAVKPAAHNFKKGILVCATDRTLKEEKLNNLITELNAEDRVEKLSLQHLVDFAENFDFFNPSLENYILNQFKSINWDNFDSLVLGCTHFLYFEDILKAVLPKHVSLINGNRGTVLRLQSLIVENDSLLDSNHYFVSGIEKNSLYFDHYLRFLNE